MISKSIAKTQKIAKDLVKKIPKSKNHAFVIALEGDLGGGKTTFVQGLAKGLNIKEKITSPTFVIYKKYGNFYHFDCYRIEKPKEILNLGFKEIIQNPKNIIAIEWADKIKRIIPKHALWVSFKFVDQSKREINMIE